VSLRARLLLGLVVLVAAGLGVAAIVTYTEQRSFLLSRLDQQVLAAVDPIFQQLGVHHDGDMHRPRGGRLDSLPSHGFITGAGGPPGGPPPQSFLPSGTYGAQLNSAGQVVGNPKLACCGTGGAGPALPRHYPVSSSVSQPHLFTTNSSSGGSLRYRVLALVSAGPGASAGTTVVGVPLSAVDQTLHRLLLVELLVAGGVLLGVIALALVVIRVGLRPLEQMERVAGEIAAGDLARRVSPATPRTEVGRLGLALNGMLVRIEQAFADRRASEERLRRFLSDASHELRTPLASIRGYAELFRLGATRDGADLERAMARIESEAARMGVLVEDLLLLARLDELPRSRRDTVDLRELAERVAADARAIAPDRLIDVRSDGPALVAGDPDQLHQVLANIVRNAATYTPAGTPIELRLQQYDAQVRVEIRDHGPGLPEGAADRVFERFWRSEPGRARGRGGAGLGLAIAQAIVQAHAGEVDARNAPGGGALFEVRLPELAGGVGAQSSASLEDDESTPNDLSASARTPPTRVEGEPTTVDR
jgi:two-component system OmpR family sensor kinase